MAGNLDSIKVESDHGDSYKVIISIDGQVLPNLTLSKKMFEDINAGESVTLYGFFKNSSSKEKNSGVIYGMQKGNGNKTFATHIRFTLPLLMMFYAALAFCVVFPLTWLISVIPMMTLIGAQHSTGLEYTTILALVGAVLAASFFLWVGWNMLRKTSNPDAWKMMGAAELSSRFSKLHK